MIKILLKFNAAVIKELQMTNDILTVGRKPDNDLVIDNPAISGHHARILKQAGSYFVEDLKSTNGTYLNGKRVLKSGLRSKDEIGLAKHSIVFINEDADNVKAAPMASSEPVSSDATMVVAPTAKKKPAEGQGEQKEKVGFLRAVGGGSGEYSLAGLTTYIGKAEQAAIRLKGLFAPDLAACVVHRPEGYLLKVIKEKSVKLNEKTISDQQTLKEGDLIEIANLKLVFTLK